MNALLVGIAWLVAFGGFVGGNERPPFDRWVPVALFEKELVVSSLVKGIHVFISPPYVYDLFSTYNRGEVDPVQRLSFIGMHFTARTDNSRTVPCNTIICGDLGWVENSHIMPIDKVVGWGLPVVFYADSGFNYALTSVCVGGCEGAPVYKDIRSLLSLCPRRVSPLWIRSRIATAPLAIAMTSVTSSIGSSTNLPRARQSSFSLPSVLDSLAVQSGLQSILTAATETIVLLEWYWSRWGFLPPYSRGGCSLFMCWENFVDLTKQQRKQRRLKHLCRWRRSQIIAVAARLAMAVRLAPSPSCGPGLGLRLWFGLVAADSARKPVKQPAM